MVASYTALRTRLRSNYSGLIKDIRKDGRGLLVQFTQHVEFGYEDMQLYKLHWLDEDMLLAHVEIPTLARISERPLPRTKRSFLSRISSERGFTIVDMKTYMEATPQAIASEKDAKLKQIDMYSSGNARYDTITLQIDPKYHDSAVLLSNLTYAELKADTVIVMFMRSSTKPRNLNNALLLKLLLKAVQGENVEEKWNEKFGFEFGTWEEVAGGVSGIEEALGI